MSTCSLGFSCAGGTRRDDLAAHVAAGSARFGGQRRDERVRARGRLRAGPGRRGVHHLHPRRSRRTPRRSSSSRATGWCTCTPVTTACPRRNWRPRWMRSPRASPTICGVGQGRCRSRQLLVERRRRPPPEAPTRHSAGVDVPHAGPRQGRGWGPGTVLARSGRSRDDRLQRRHLCQLSRRRAPVPAAVRQPCRCHRDRRARRSSMRSSRQGNVSVLAAPSGCRSTSRSSCSSVASSP